MKATLSRLKQVDGVADFLDVVMCDTAPPDIGEVLSRSDTSKVSVLESNNSRVLKLLRDRFVNTGMWVARDSTGCIVELDYNSHGALEDQLEDLDVPLGTVTCGQEHAVLREASDDDDDEHGGVRRLVSTEFLHEVLVGVGLHRALVEAGITPHVTRTIAGLAYEGRGYLVQQRAECTLHDAMLDRLEGVRMDGPAVAGVLLQVLHALACAQVVAGFKHHDLHAHNVFMHRLDDAVSWRGVVMSQATHLAYTVGEHTYYVPNTLGLLPCLADFGLASVHLPCGLRVERADLGAFGGSDRGKWGEWTPELRDRRGYDAQVLMHDCADLGRSCRLSKHRKLRALLLRMQRVCSRGGGVVQPKCIRPDVVCDMPPSAVLQAVFGEAPDAWYDFRTPPPLGRILHVAATPLLEGAEEVVAPPPTARGEKQPRARGGGGGGKKKRRAVGRG